MRFLQKGLYNLDPTIAAPTRQQRRRRGNNTRPRPTRAVGADIFPVVLGPRHLQNSARFNRAIRRGMRAARHYNAGNGSGGLCYIYWNNEVSPSFIYDADQQRFMITAKGKSHANLMEALTNANIHQQAHIDSVYFVKNKKEMLKWKTNSITFRSNCPITEKLPLDLFLANSTNGDVTVKQQGEGSVGHINYNQLGGVNVNTDVDSYQAGNSIPNLSFNVRRFTDSSCASFMISGTRYLENNLDLSVTSNNIISFYDQNSQLFAAYHTQVNWTDVYDINLFDRTTHRNLKDSAMIRFYQGNLQAAQQPYAIYNKSTNTLTIALHATLHEVATLRRIFINSIIIGPPTVSVLPQSIPSVPTLPRISSNRNSVTPLSSDNEDSFGGVIEPAQSSSSEELEKTEEEVPLIPRRKTSTQNDTGSQSPTNSEKEPNIPNNTNPDDSANKLAELRQLLQIANENLAKAKVNLDVLTQANDIRIKELKEKKNKAKEKIRTLSSNEGKSEAQQKADELAVEFKKPRLQETRTQLAIGYVYGFFRDETSLLKTSIIQFQTEIEQLQNQIKALENQNQPKV